MTNDNTETEHGAPTLARYRAYCSDCITTVRATEVHAIRGGEHVAYCARCAPTWRPYADHVYTLLDAWRAGIRLPVPPPPTRAPGVRVVPAE